MTPLRCAIENGDSEMCALLLHFGASLAKHMSVPKSTQHRMMAGIDYARHLAKKEKDEGKGEKYAAALEVLSDEAALKKATDAVLEKLQSQMKARNARMRQREKAAIRVVIILFTAILSWWFVFNDLFPRALRGWSTKEF